MGFKKELYKIVDAHDEAPIIHSSKRHVGIIMTFSGYIFFAMYTVFFQVEAFEYHALDSPYAVFFQFAVLNLVMIVTFFVFSLGQGVEYFKCYRPGYVILRALIEIPLLGCYSLARIWTHNVDNSILYSTDIFWLVLILYMLKIPTPKGLWAGVLIGTGGIMYIYLYDFSSLHDLIGGVFGTISGISLAFIIFLSRYLIRKDPPLRIGFYNSVVNFIFFACGTIIFGFLYGWESPSGPALAMMIVSGFIWSLALFFFLEALYFAENHIIGGIALFLPIFIEAFNWTTTKSLFSWTTLIGSSIMAVGGLIIIIISYHNGVKNGHNKNKRKQIKFPEFIKSKKKNIKK